MKLATFNPFAKPPTVNNAGGSTYVVDPFVRLNRFLMLGSESGSYYVNARALTLENAANLRKCLVEDGVRTVREIVAVSEAGRAPRQDPSIFALAVAACQGDDPTRAEALAALPRVCRTGTHLFQFLQTANAGRGWGRALRRSVGSWYGEKGLKALELQLVKYRQRDGWTHRDVLRLSHPTPPTEGHGALYRWAAGKAGAPEGGLAEAMEALAKLEDSKAAAALIRASRLPREAVPTEMLREPSVWSALLDDMPMTAMIRNLATMTRLGLLTEKSPETKIVCERLRDVSRLKQARVHPVAVLMALRTYASGRGERSDKTWVPVGKIVAALDDAFHLAFSALEPSGRRFVVGVDVSGSMSWAVMGSGMSCAEGAAAMAMALVHVEPEVHVMGFAERFRPLALYKGLRLDAALAVTRGLTFGATDCGLPMRWARENRVRAETFVVITDNETYAGARPPMEELRAYREETGIDAGLVVIGMTATDFSIADPDDPKTLDIAGFDASVPELVTRGI